MTGTNGPTGVAVLGTGLMGAPMAVRLAALGHRVTAYNRTQSRARGLSGVTVASTPARAVRSAECVVTMLADGPATREVLLEEGVRRALAGRTVIQMATIGPWESRELAVAVTGARADYLEAPVLGSRSEAAAGQLQVMVGATAEQFDTWRPLLAAFGPNPVLVGEVGQAAALKLALNQLIASHIAAFSLSLGIVRREEVPVEVFMDILRQSALYALMFDKKLGRLLGRRFTDPNFPVRLLLKDVDLILTEAQRLELDAASLAGVRQVILEAMDQGWLDEDYSAVYSAIDRPPIGRH